ncbi:formyltetrahydrofolate deformylase [Salsipaludibacter albus]|uniref:formyltetrahydrofolate deformylase n=1 Tax=Salsipaludibacter albus TaxID=2849650 RepID=UPI001EE4C76B|nr:formyltetrahydrofolate deformylase [Salsipaludibacter albus]MBY5162324.1 formyltetrahydrofolate deformylase [Salsipaludibacter albus]
MTSHVLTLICPDRPGIVHAVCGALLEVGGNITENAQFGDPDTDLFCMRTVFDADTDDSDEVARLVAAALDVDQVPGGRDAGVRLRVRPVAHRPVVMVLVSRTDHCLEDLLYRWRNDLLPIDIPAVVSNHDDLRDQVERHGIPFHHLPVSGDTRPDQEAAILDLVERHDVELVVLARYMQILSDDLCTRLAGRAINIHHSFLPGFKGARPYHRAHERGVKLVGATAHFVTADLDEGPIIEQDVARVTHAHTPDQLVELGQDTERRVLSRAVRWWAEDRILLLGDRTVVFP